MPSFSIREGHYEIFPYHNKIGIRGIGCSEQEAFEQAAVALSNLTTNSEKIRENKIIFIRCQASNHRLLLLNWLNAIIYEAGRQKMLFKRFRVNFINHHLEGIAWGEKTNLSEHFPVEAKEINPEHLLLEKQLDGHWIAECVIET